MATIGIEYEEKKYGKVTVDWISGASAEYDTGNVVVDFIHAVCDIVISGGVICHSSSVDDFIHDHRDEFKFIKIDLPVNRYRNQNSAGAIVPIDVKGVDFWNYVNANKKKSEIIGDVLLLLAIRPNFGTAKLEKFEKAISVMNGRKIIGIEDEIEIELDFEESEITGCSNFVFDPNHCNYGESNGWFFTVIENGENSDLSNEWLEALAGQKAREHYEEARIEMQRAKNKMLALGLIEQ